MACKRLIIKILKKILDIGCAFGNFLDVAKQNGWDVYASEINKDAVKVLNKKNTYFKKSV